MVPTLQPAGFPGSHARPAAAAAPTVARVTPDFRRDRLTWVAYLMLAWFAYLQAAPGLVIAHLRDEFGLSYSVGGLHVAAFAAGSVLAGLSSATVERALGRRRLLWSAALLMAAGVVGLTAGRAVPVTLLSVLVMGLGGGLLLATVRRRWPTTTASTGRSR
jgi:fucose permease